MRVPNPATVPRVSVPRMWIADAALEEMLHNAHRGTCQSLLVRRHVCWLVVVVRVRKNGAEIKKRKIPG